MHFRSDLAALTAAALAVIITAGNYFITEDVVVEEDVYVATQRATMAGRIEGDLVIASGPVFISGEVTGDLIALSNQTIIVTGTIGGSIRAVATGTVDIVGTVGGDVAVAAPRVEVSGDVGRDVLVFATDARVDGTVGRDLRGQALNVTLDGTIGGNMDMAVQALRLEASAEVGENVVYRSNSEAVISGGAVVEGTVRKLPARFTFFARVWLTVATLVSFLAFLFGGIASFYLLRRTAPRAASALVLRPIASMVAGFAFFFVVPTLVVSLFITLVGIPVAVMLLLVFLLALVLGPVPALAAAGDRLLRGRSGLIGSFLFAAVLWRTLLWLVPFAGLFFYVLALVWGTGAWVIGAWEVRRRAVDVPPRSPRPEVPAVPIAPADWEAPLPPLEETQAGAPVAEAVPAAAGEGAEPPEDGGHGDDPSQP